MSIQQVLDEQSTSSKEDGPLGNVSIEGETGSFKLTQGQRLRVANSSDATCSGTEGPCELSFVNVDDVTVQGFQGGVLRFENCSSIQEVTCTAKTTIHVQGAQIQNLNLTNARGVIAGCQIQQAQYQDCELQSLDNQYQTVTVDSGRITFDSDQFQSLTCSGQGVWTFLKPSLQSGTASISDGVANLTGTSGQASLTVSKARLIDVGGQYQDVTASGTGLQLTLRDTQLQGDFGTQDGTSNLSGVQVQGDVKVTSGNLNANTLQAQGDLKVQGSSGSDTPTQVSMLSCTFQGDGDLQSCQARFSKVTFQGDVTLQDSTLDSTDSTYQGDFSATGRTVESRRDTFQGDLELDQMIGFNSIWLPSGSMQSVSLTGQDATSTIQMFNATCQDLTVEQFGTSLLVNNTSQSDTFESLDGLILRAHTGQSTTMQDVSSAVVDDSQIQTLDASQIGTLQLNQGSAQTVTLQDVGACLASTCSISTLTSTDTDLLVISDVGTATVQGGTTVDDGSTVTLTDGNILGQSGGTYTTTGSNVLTVGDTVTASDFSLVLAADGSSVTNVNGVTVGNQVEDSTNFVTLTSDGAQGTLSCIIDLNVKALTGNLVETAALSASRTAGVNVTDDAGESLIEIAGGTASRTAGADISDEATGVHSTQAALIKHNG